jgi:hypothetical protein
VAVRLDLSDGLESDEVERLAMEIERDLRESCRRCARSSSTRPRARSATTAPGESPRAFNGGQARRVG